MKNKAIAIFNLVYFVAMINPAWPLSGQHVVELKKAGVGDQTIQVIAQTKVIESAAFSIDDIVKMKKAGIGEKTLRMIIEEGSHVKNSEPVVYGRSTQTIRHISPEDIINLTQNGVSDEVIQSVLEANRSENQQDREQVWRMLDSMGLGIIPRVDRDKPRKKPVPDFN